MVLPGPASGHRAAGHGAQGALDPDRGIDVHNPDQDGGDGAQRVRDRRKPLLVDREIVREVAVPHHDAAGDAILLNSSNEAYMESDQLWAQPATFGYPSTINTGSDMTITGTGHVVLRLRDFILTGGTFTLVGTSPGTTFVFNISRAFSLSGSARIVLSGITASNVIFNVRGGSNAAAISGSAAFQGILLANYRNVKISGGTVNGEIVGNRVVISGGATLFHASP